MSASDYACTNVHSILQVTFLEKSGTSPLPNSTGAYELDLSLINDNKKAWREMHVKSDVFCAGTVIYRFCSSDLPQLVYDSESHFAR
jgi:hypothetical protein